MSIGKVEASRKLLAPSFGGFGNVPGLNLPPFPRVTQWPEYRLPPFFRNIPNYYPPVPSGPRRSFFSPPTITTSNP
ncbi:hypothetical protein VNO77_05222 [Canavalia gladiata]|uniref:Uncharacterized protein n=1 Tax=Canavalia gladiata TaxID=3824 RepID=A0AAN9RDY9_CANGL